MLVITPIFQEEAFAFISKYHRHHKEPIGSVFQIAVIDEDKNIADIKPIEVEILDLFGNKVNRNVKKKIINPKIVGVAVVGRPVARMSQNGLTLEVTRLCTDGTKNACSMLYSACWRATKALGYRKLITYILDNEPGTSLKASGWKLIGERGGGSWSVPSRPRTDKHPLQPKQLFQIEI
jgi:hypothetical protein